MTRVDEHNSNREVERREEERQIERTQRERDALKSQEFSKIVSEKKAETHKETTQDRKAKTQTTKTKTAQQKNSASSKLMARQGIASQGFEQNLRARAEGGKDQDRVKSKVRGEAEKAETQRTGDQQDGQSTAKRLGQQGDRLAAISRDDRQGQKDGDFGSGKQDSGAQSGFGPAHGELAGQVPPGMLAGNIQPQGGAGAGLSAQVIAQIVDKVMVGLNKEGLSEFTIQFKDNTLAGALLSITAQNNQVSARFVTTDPNVRRLLKASTGQLMRALDRKGLTLTRLDVDER